LNWRGQSEWKQGAIPQKSDDFELLKIEILTRTPEYSKWKLLKVNLYYLQTVLYFHQPFNLHYVSYMLWCSHFRKETEQNYPIVILPNWKETLLKTTWWNKNNNYLLFMNSSMEVRNVRASIVLNNEFAYSFILFFIFVNVNIWNLRIEFE